MDVRTFIVIITVIICALIIFLNERIFRVQNRILEDKLCENNKKIIFVNNYTLDIKNENYKSSDFFLMRNGGDLKIYNFEYIKYSKKEDYYL